MRNRFIFETAAQRQSGNRDDDLVDTVVVLLKGDADELPPFSAIGKDSLPFERIEIRATPHQHKRYGFLGFPSCKGNVDRRDRDVRSRGYVYVASSAPPEAY